MNKTFLSTSADLFKLPQTFHYLPPFVLINALFANEKFNCEIFTTLDFILALPFSYPSPPIYSFSPLFFGPPFAVRSVFRRVTESRFDNPKTFRGVVFNDERMSFFPTEKKIDSDFFIPKRNKQLMSSTTYDVSDS